MSNWAQMLQTLSGQLAGGQGGEEGSEQSSSSSDDGGFYEAVGANRNAPHDDEEDEEEWETESDEDDYIPGGPPHLPFPFGAAAQANQPPPVHQRPVLPRVGVPHIFRQTVNLAPGVNIQMAPFADDEDEPEEAPPSMRSASTHHDPNTLGEGADVVRPYLCCNKCDCPFVSKTEVITTKKTIDTKSTFHYDLEDDILDLPSVPCYSATNPGKVRYDVACVEPTVNGLGLRCDTARFSPDASWFPGYEWCQCSCGKCGQHMGWGFGPTDETKKTLPLTPPGSDGESEASVGSGLDIDPVDLPPRPFVFEEDIEVQRGKRNRERERIKINRKLSFIGLIVTNCRTKTRSIVEVDAARDNFHETSNFLDDYQRDRTRLMRLLRAIPNQHTANQLGMVVLGMDADPDQRHNLPMLLGMAANLVPAGVHLEAPEHDEEDFGEEEEEEEGSEEMPALEDASDLDVEEEDEGEEENERPSSSDEDDYILTPEELFAAQALLAVTTPNSTVASPTANLQDGRYGDGRPIQRDID